MHRKAGEPCPRCGTTIEAVHYEDYVMCYCPHDQTGGKVLADDQAEALVAETNKFKNSYLTHDGKRVVNEAEAAAMDADDVEQEQIKIRK